MKKIFLLVLIFISFKCFSQSTEDTVKYFKYPNTYGVQYVDVWATGIMRLPDTATKHPAPNVPGALGRDELGLDLFLWDGIQWNCITKPDWQTTLDNGGILRSSNSIDVNNTDLTFNNSKLFGIDAITINLKKLAGGSNGNLFLTTDADGNVFLKEPEVPGGGGSGGGGTLRWWDVLKNGANIDDNVIVDANSTDWDWGNSGYFSKFSGRASFNNQTGAYSQIFGDYQSAYLYTQDVSELNGSELFSKPDQAEIESWDENGNNAYIFVKGIGNIDIKGNIKLIDYPNPGGKVLTTDNAGNIVFVDAGSGGGGSSTWGSITGTLSDQTDLQSALDLKLSNINGIAAGGDLSGTYANPNVVWPNGYTTYDARYLTSTSKNQLLSGGRVVWLHDYVYNVSAATYLIDGILYSSSSTDITLSAADATNDRIDLFVLTTSSTAIAITGTPSTPAVAPDYDANTQLQISFATVTAATTEPIITNEWVYKENTEWTTTASAGTINLASTNNPYAGTKDIEGSAVANGTYMTFTSVSTLAIGNYTDLIFEIRSKANWGTAKKWIIRFYNGSTAIGNAVNFGSSSYGFVSNATSQYQNITIKLADFGNISAATGFRITQSNTTGTVGWYLDNIQLQGDFGGGTPQSITFVGDISGTGTNTINSTVVGIKNKVVPTLSAGFFKYTGSNWTFDASTYLTANQTISFSSSGDVSSSGGSSATALTPALTVTGIKGASVPTLSTGNLRYNGSAWIFDASTYLQGLGITGATKTKITYNANGLVTAGADATTSDIAEGSNLYYTDARARTSISYTGENYLSYNSTTGALTGSAVNLSGTNATGILAAARFPALTGDVTTSSGAVATTLATVNSSIGTFNNVTINAKGLATAGSNVAYLTANQSITVTATGDATGTSTSSPTAPSLPLVLATVNSNVGTFGDATHVGQFTVNAKGLITSASNVTFTAPTPSLTSTQLAFGDGSNLITSSANLTYGSSAMTILNTAITTTTTAGLILNNSTAAAAGNNKRSPAISIRTNGWKTNATAASRAIQWDIDVLPVQGAANPTSQLVLQPSVNGSALFQNIILGSNGSMSIQGGNSDGDGLTISAGFIGVNVNAQSTSVVIAGTNNLTTVTSNYSTSGNITSTGGYTAFKIQAPVTALNLGNADYMGANIAMSITGSGSVFTTAPFSIRGYKTSFTLGSTNASSVVFPLHEDFSGSLILPVGILKDITDSYGLRESLTALDGNPTGKVVNRYDAYFDTINVNIIRTKHVGIWQNGTDAFNYLNGKTSIGDGGENTPTYNLQVIGTFYASGASKFDNVANIKSYTVATLPAGTVGDIAYVTDATAPTYLGTLTGSGSIKTPVFYNGSAWVSF